MSEYKGDGGAFDDNYKLKPFWRWVFLLVAMMLIPFCVHADTVTYTSQTLTGSSSLVDGANTSTSPLTDVYIVTVTISGPLAPNLNMALIAPQSWTVTCQNCQVALSSNPLGLTNSPDIYVVATAAVFLFSTDATGKITAWNFAISGNSTVNDPNGNQVSQNSGSFVSGDTGVSSMLSDGQLYSVNITGPRGTWAQSSLANPAPAAQQPPQKVQPNVRLWFGRSL